MQCKDVENYIKSSDKYGFDEGAVVRVYEHAENCQTCKEKLALEKSIKSKLTEHYSSINPSPNLKNKIDQLTNKIEVKPALIAACLVVLLGLGIFIERTILRLPNIYELHNLDNFHVVSNDIERLSNHVGVRLNKTHLVHFNNNGYLPHEALKVSKLLRSQVNLLALKNKSNHKISICFLPRTYNLPYHTKKQIKNTHIYHGNSDSNHFIFWQGNMHTIALVSKNNMSHDELTELAYDLIGKI